MQYIEVGNIATVVDDDVAVFIARKRAAGQNLIVLNKDYVGFYEPPPNEGTLNLETYILGRPPVGYVIDHIDRCPWNNVRSNLRLVTCTQNKQNVGLRRDNKSGYKGVKVNNKGYIYAQLQVNGQIYISPQCRSTRDAALAYDLLVIQHGSLAPTNKSLGLL